MHEALSRNLFLVKEHVGMFKAASNYDILDPETNRVILECRENRLGVFTKVLRFAGWKRMTAFNVEIQTPQGERLIRVHRGVSIFLSNVSVCNEQDTRIGGFQQMFFPIGGGFTVLDANDQPAFQLKGKWTGWDFRFMNGDVELAHVTKKWAGLGKEMFTSADNYILQISDQVPPDDPVRQLILGAVMCIDMVLKE